MDSAIGGPSPIRSKHEIWRSIRCIASRAVSCDIPSHHDLNGSYLGHVVYKDVSTSVDSMSGMNDSSHEPDIDPGAKAGDGLPDACKQKTTSEQELLLKHGNVVSRFAGACRLPVPTIPLCADV